MAVSPDGTTVFVTGGSAGGTDAFGYATLAYAAGTGVIQWVRRFNGPASIYDFAQSLAVSPDGTTVFVTGLSARPNNSLDYATVAYAAGTGATQWVRRYNGAHRDDRAQSLVVSPDGATVYVTGRSEGSSSRLQDYATVAYDAGTGATQWVRRYGSANGDDGASSVAVSPDGATVFVTGGSTGPTGNGDYATVAYASVTGATQWVRRYNSPANGGDYATAVALSPDGTTLFVTGVSDGSTSSLDYATVAYAA